MDIEILKQDEQHLLDRKVIKAALTFEGATPSRKEVLSSLASALKTKEDHLVLKTVRSAFGRTRAVVTAHLYKDKDLLAKHEPSYMLQRGKPKEKKGAKKAEEKEE